MENEYAVSIANEPVGKVCVTRQGLYYRFQCYCKLSGNVVYRLVVSYGSDSVNIGVLVPDGSAFCLDKKLPTKYFTENEPKFMLIPHRETSERVFAEIYPEEPFCYLDRVKNSFLCYQNGKPGLMIQTGDA